MVTNHQPVTLKSALAVHLDRTEHMFYCLFTRFAGQVRNRCSRETCPGWFPEIHTRRYTESRLLSPTRPPLSREGEGLGVRASWSIPPLLRLHQQSAMGHQQPPPSAGYQFGAVVGNAGTRVRCQKPRSSSACEYFCKETGWCAGRRLRLVIGSHGAWLGNRDSNPNYLIQRPFQRP